MILHRLVAENFKVFGERIELEFPEKGRIGIFGPNESGKTTLFQAIEYALYGLKKGPGIEEQRENLVTWGKSETKLELEFSSAEKRYRMARRFGVQSGHSARLVPVIDGNEDKRNEITSITAIEAMVEQLTGMDRDSFAKLIYMRQKDLDALKDLVKSQREQLLNKVMGIDLFDKASDKVKADASSEKAVLDQKRSELERVKANKEEYDEKMRFKTKLQAEEKQLDLQVKECAKELGEANRTYEGHEWLYAFYSSNELLKSKEGELEQVLAQREGLEKIRTSVIRYEEVIARDAEIVQELQDQQRSFQEIEARIKDLMHELGESNRAKSSAIEQMGLEKEAAMLTPVDLGRLKSRNLQLTGILGALASIVLVVGLLWNQSLVLLVACMPAILGIHFFRRYLRADRLFTKLSEVRAYFVQIASLSNQLEKAQEDLLALKNKSGHSDSGEVKRDLDEALRRIRAETGHDSLEALGGAVRDLKAQEKSVASAGLEQKSRTLENEISELTDKVKTLSMNRPEGISAVGYDPMKHYASKQVSDSCQTRLNELSSKLKTTRAIIEQADGDLERLRGDYIRFPDLDLEVKEFERRANLLNRIIEEMKETGRELRAKVIPQASYIINQILPLITDGRYSDFEISEDLKFKVHSSSAGGYKEREIFSGGTQDQFLIALRLAFTQSILESRVAAERHCLLMDECISSSDNSRKLGIFEVLDAMKATFQQIFIISHEDLSNLVDHHIVLLRNDRGYTEVRSKSS